MGTVRSIGNSGFWICNQTRNVTADFNAEIHVLRFPFFPFFSFFFVKSDLISGFARALQEHITWHA